MSLPEHVRPYLGLMVCIMAVTTADGAVTVLLPSMLQRQGKDPATVGALVATLAITALFIRLPGGLIYSEKRAPRLMVGALVLSTLSVVFFPLTPNPGLLAVIGAAYGMGYSLSTTVNMALFVGSLADNPQRNQAVSLYAGSMAFGYALGALGGGAAANWFGFTAAFLLVSATCVLGLGLVVMNRSIWRAPSHVASAAPPRTAGSLRRIARDPLVLFIVSGAFFINIFLAQFNTFMPLTLLPLGVSLAQIGVIRSVWSLTNAFGRSFGSGVLSRLGARRAQTGGLLLQAVVLTLFAAHLPFGAYLLLTVFAASGRAIGYIANTVALTEVNPQQLSRGMASGVMNAAGDLGKIVGPVTGGLIARQFGLSTFWLITPPLFMALYCVCLGIASMNDRARKAGPTNIGDLEPVKSPTMAAKIIDESVI